MNSKNLMDINKNQKFRKNNSVIAKYNEKQLFQSEIKFQNNQNLKTIRENKQLEY